VEVLPHHSYFQFHLILEVPCLFALLELEEEFVVFALPVLEEFVVFAPPLVQEGVFLLFPGLLG
jgi:hypothetical protein